MVSLTHGNHSIKIGGDIRRNIENSEFNVARPSYYFADMAFFAIDSPHDQTAGVNPDICAPPCTSFNQLPQAQLSSNIRHWRNIEAGLYFQDDWKVLKRLTLNLGLRWDKYQRHNEEANTATTFLRGPGNQIIDNLATGQGWLQQANAPVGTTGVCDTSAQVALAQIAKGLRSRGICPLLHHSARGAARTLGHDWGLPGMCLATARPPCGQGSASPMRELCITLCRTRAGISRTTRSTMQLTS